MTLEKQPLGSGNVHVGYFEETDTTITGLGFEPAHIEFWAIKHDTLNSEQDFTGGLPFSMGFATQDNQIVGGIGDNSDSVDGHYQYFGTGDVVYVIDTDNAGLNRSGATICNVSSFDADGFTVNYTESNVSTFVGYRATG